MKGTSKCLLNSRSTMDLYTLNKKQLNSIFRLIVEIDMITDSILTGTAPGGKYYEYRYVKRLLEDLSGEEAANKWSGSSYLWTRDVQSCTGQGYGRQYRRPSPGSGSASSNTGGLLTFVQCLCPASLTMMVPIGSYAYWYDRRMTDGQTCGHVSIFSMLLGLLHMYRMAILSWAQARIAPKAGNRTLCA